MKIEEMSITLSNADDENRSYKLCGTVKKERYTDILKVEGGDVRTTDTDTWLASFSEPAEGQLSINYANKENRTEILAEAEAFVDELRGYALQNMPTE